MVHVPYRGAAPALADVAGGQLPVLMCDLAASRRFMQSGKLRALAVAHPQRLKELPGVPSFAELGMPRVEAAALHGAGGAGQHAGRTGHAAAAVGGQTPSTTRRCSASWPSSAWSP
jgi:tripartite-type tricarboxylate transporter receptor subunit TctC